MRFRDDAPPEREVALREVPALLANSPMQWATRRYSSWKSADNARRRLREYIKGEPGVPSLKFYEFRIESESNGHALLWGRCNKAVRR